MRPPAFIDVGRKDGSPVFLTYSLSCQCNDPEGDEQQINDLAKIDFILHVLLRANELIILFDMVFVRGVGALRRVKERARL